MLMSEFIERTGITPNAEEYEKIEQEYYNFDGNKDAFCKSFMENRLMDFISARGKRIDVLKNSIAEIERTFRIDSAKQSETIKKLQADLDKELEWTPYENEHNVKQTDYEQLAADSTTRELTDEEATEMISNEFGFERSKIMIVHEVVKTEINRHHQCRKVGMIPRKALFNAWDWNYIVFNIKGNTTMGYEMYNGELQMYWG